MLLGNVLLSNGKLICTLRRHFHVVVCILLIFYIFPNSVYKAKFCLPMLPRACAKDWGQGRAVYRGIKVKDISSWPFNSITFLVQSQNITWEINNPRKVSVVYNFN